MLGMSNAKKRKTTVGHIDPDVLAYTAGNDTVLDKALIEVDCLGTAAHVTMLSKIAVSPRLFTPADLKKITGELAAICEEAAAGKFKITLADQDVHLAVERTLTKRLGDLGKKVHTARSRNDQVAVDLRLFAKEELLAIADEMIGLIKELLKMGKRHINTPMVGRTHMQPAMPSSVALWATAHAESLLDDLEALKSMYNQNDQCPLGSAAGYGVPVDINRQLVSDLLGFDRLCHNVLYASNARGKIEGVILNGLGQIMLSLSRIAQDLMLYTMPEFNYFSLPAAFCTGSSIMPNKSNPDVMELVRARTSSVLAAAHRVSGIISGAPSGYNRDLQEAKEPFLQGLEMTRQSVAIMRKCLGGMAVNKASLLAGFNSGVFATDRALELVIAGMPFRDAYHAVKAGLDDLEGTSPHEAIKLKTHAGGTAGLDFTAYTKRVAEQAKFVSAQQRKMAGVKKKLLG